MTNEEKREIAEAANYAYKTTMSTDVRANVVMAIAAALDAYDKLRAADKEQPCP